MTDAERKAALAKIHVGKKLLGLDEETYRDLLEAETGRRSASKLDAAGLRRVLARMRADGAVFSPGRKSGSGSKSGSRPVPRRDVVVAIKTIDALCINHPGGRKPRAWAEAILQRMESHPHRVPLEWSDERRLQDVATAIRQDIRRHEREARMKRRGESHG